MPVQFSHIALLHTALGHWSLSFPLVPLGEVDTNADVSRLDKILSLERSTFPMGILQVFTAAAGRKEERIFYHIKYFHSIFCSLFQ